MRTLVPAETLVYLETNDLAAALQPIVDAKPFKEVAKSKPDFSALKGVQLAVAVTGFETSEEKLTDEHSVGRVQPRFVAVAETHAWNYQANAFAEQKLGGFVREIYDSEPTLEKSDKNGGKYFKWTATDGRKAFALVDGSVIYFGNDETAIDKCLAVKRGESDSIAKTGKVKPSDATTLASGHVSTDGIAQIANIIGLKYASEIGEDSKVQSAIAGILPQLLRSSITDITWTASQTEKGIEDKYLISMPPDIANVLSETMVPAAAPETALLDFLPQGPKTATLYNLRNPQIAWRSVILIMQKQLPASTGPIIPLFAAALFGPYGISQPEQFLSSIGSTIVTANDGVDGEKPVAIAHINNPTDLKRSVSSDLVEADRNASISKSVFDEDILGVSYVNGRVHIGNANTVIGVSTKETQNPTDLKPYLREYFSSKGLPITTYTYDNEIVAALSEIFGVEKGDHKAGSVSVTETRFTRTAIERRTISDFGLIGSIIAQLGGDE